MDFLERLILAVIGESNGISRFKLYASLFILSFLLKEEFEKNGIDLEQFRRDMLEAMERELSRK